MFYTKQLILLGVVYASALSAADSLIPPGAKPTNLGRVGAGESPLWHPKASPLDLRTPNAVFWGLNPVQMAACRPVLATSHQFPEALAPCSRASWKKPASSKAFAKARRRSSSQSALALAE